MGLIWVFINPSTSSSAKYYVIFLAFIYYRLLNPLKNQSINNLDAFGTINKQ
jgi:hypothetical protein